MCRHQTKVKHNSLFPATEFMSLLQYIMDAICKYAFRQCGLKKKINQHIKKVDIVDK